jgi:hypothetical protein
MYWDITPPVLSTGNRPSLEPQVFKVLKENPDNFKDLSNLADCDVDVSVTAARRLVIKLHDSRGKIKAMDENLNNPCSKHIQPLEQNVLPLQVQIRSCILKVDRKE